MRRFLKILFALVVLVVAATGAAVFLIPQERVVQLAADQVRAATGRELVLADDISPSFWPVLGVRTGSVRLSNAQWGEADDMISASAAEIGVELMPLFSGDIRVTTLRLVDPVVVLEIGEDGRPNWEFEGGSGSGGGGSGVGDGGLPRISLPVASVTNGHVSFRDARTGQRFELAELDLTAGLEGMNAPLTLKGSGQWNGKAAKIDAVIDTPAAVAEGRRAAVRFMLDSDPAKVGFDGEIEAAQGGGMPFVEGKVTASLPSPPGALGWATGTPPPPGLDQVGAVNVEAAVTAAEAALSLAAGGTAQFQGRTVAFTLTANGDKGWAERNAYTVSVGARTEGVFELSFSGPVSAGAAPAAEGPLTVIVTDLRGLAKWLGGTDLTAPDGTFQSARVDTRLALEGGERIDLSALEMRVDGTPLTGEAGVDLGGARPMVTARLQSGPLDLTPFMAPGEGGGGQGGRDGGWSTEPLDLSALRAVDADVAIRAEAVDLGDIEIGRTDIDARLRDGRLDMNIRRVDAYGGGMNGTVAVVAGDGAEVAADVTVSQVQLRPLLNAMAGVDNLEGLGAFRINARGHGRSVDGLMRSLDGQGGLELTDGAILGVNLAAIVRNLTGRGGGEAQKTDFSAITGTFDITDGVLHNSDFSLLGPLIRVIGAGTVDLGNRRQDFRLEPKAVANLTGQGGSLADTGLGIFPVLVTGTWSNPVIKPDLTAAVTGLMSDPKGTVDAVTGLVKGGSAKDAADALLGGLTGGSGSGTSGSGGSSGSGTQDVTGGIGGALGGLLGGGGKSSESGKQDSGLGGLLGALGGSSKRSGGATGGSGGGQTAPEPVTEQAAVEPSAAAQAADGELAPLEAPMPRPAPPDRADRAAALDRPAGTAPEPAAETPAAPGEAAPADDPVQEGKKLLDGLLKVLPQ